MALLGVAWRRFSKVQHAQNCEIGFRFQQVARVTRRCLALLGAVSRSALFSKNASGVAWREYGKSKKKENGSGVAWRQYEKAQNMEKHENAKLLPFLDVAHF